MAHDDTDLDTIGGRIRAAIRRAGYRTDKAFAEAIGKERSAVSRWINDADRGISDESLTIIAEATNESVGWLRYGDGGYSTTSIVSRGTEMVTNRAHGWIGRIEHTTALRRGEGELTYGDAAIDGMAEAREKGWNAEELLTALDWLASKLHWSEQQRIALQRAARSGGDQPGA